MTTDDTITDETTYCAVHPDRETSLRCNRCERYMCAQCAVPTPVGYRCKQCVRQVEDTFFSGTNVDYVVVFLAAAVMSALGMVAVSFVGFLWLIYFFAGILIGGIIARTSLRLVNRRRGRYTAQFAAAGVIAGTGLASLLVFSGISLAVLLYAAPVIVIVYQQFK